MESIYEADCFVGSGGSTWRDSAVYGYDYLWIGDDLCQYFLCLAEYGAAHPTRYRRFRSVLERLSLFSPRPDLRHAATNAISRLQSGFRRWLGAG